MLAVSTSCMHEFAAISSLTRAFGCLFFEFQRPDLAVTLIDLSPAMSSPFELDQTASAAADEAANPAVAASPQAMGKGRGSHGRDGPYGKGKPLGRGERLW